jgi:hypothetical protein
VPTVAGQEIRGPGNGGRQDGQIRLRQVRLLYLGVLDQVGEDIEDLCRVEKVREIFTLFGTFEILPGFLGRIRGG